MEYILTAREASEADRNASEAGLPSMVLMERAALSVIEAMEEERFPLDHVLVAAGRGNNGGDGIAVARLLAERGYQPLILLYGNPERESSQFRDQLTILSQYDAKFVTAIPKEVSVIVDGLFGTGLHRDVTGEAAELIRTINESGVRVISIDIPSGVSADTGAVLSTAVRADLTVTFSFPKRGHYLYPGTERCGTLVIKPIGITKLHLSGNPLMTVGEEERGWPKGRDESGNKGTFGKILIAAGSKKMCGACCLAGKAALRSGAGMVKIYTEEANRIPLAASFPEALIDTYREGAADAEQLDEAIAFADAVLVGPGLGTGKTALWILTRILKHSERPLVLDADALNLMAANPNLWDELHVPCVITPHIMEMSRISGKPVAALKADPVRETVQFASERGVICVLKDARTVIAAPGGNAYLNLSGNSALSTAGSGDILAGLTAGLIGRLYKKKSVPEGTSQPALAELAALACDIHGRAGEASAERTSRSGVIASDLIAEIGALL